MTAPKGSEEEVALELPTDDHGQCIFHSQEIEWKRNNHFREKFFQLLQLLDSAEAGREYDFAEFAFVGSEIRIRSGFEEYFLSISDLTFRKQAYFTGASFLDSFELMGVDFQDGATFDHAIFAGDLEVEKTRFRGIDVNRARFTKRVIFTQIEFPSFALFGNAKFTGTGGEVRFEDSRFQGITDFSAAAFTLGHEGSVIFKRVQFEDVADFTGTQFDCHVDFSNVSFASLTEFIDTSFDTVRSSARYRGAAVEFNQIEVTKEAVLTFVSTDPQNKMFNHDVHMSFKEAPTGAIRFENVNFSRLTTDSKDQLTQLAKLGRVEIGSGCIKYRFQTDIRTISVDQGNAPLIVELCQTFTNYFTVSNGLILGFEIVERANTKIRFFYFTDEDISEGTFLERLGLTEQGLWNLLSIRSPEQLLALEGPTLSASSADKGSAVINAVDGISALLGTFFRVGARIALGAWKESDTKALLGAIRFNDEGADDRALTLHRVLSEKYTGTTLLGFSRQQNEQLFLKGQVFALNQTVKLLAAKGDSYFMGDKYEVSGQAGAVGPSAAAHDMTFNQIGNQIERSMNLSQLGDELSRLRQAMGQQATEPDEFVSLGEVAKAEQAAKENDSSKVAESLKSAGRWALDVATKIGVALASDALKHSMGMK